MTLVAIQGIRGSYSEEAAVTMLGDAIGLVECRDFAEVFRNVESEGTLAIIPVRNSTVGTIASTDAFLRSGSFRVRGEVTIKIDHVLAGIPGTQLSAIEVVRSHPEALKQCRKFFDENPQIKAEVGADTASSIGETVAAGAKAVAAIGSRRAAELYGAAILRENVADFDDNRTTFYLIGK